MSTRFERIFSALDPELEASHEKPDVHCTPEQIIQRHISLAEASVEGLCNRNPDDLEEDVSIVAGYIRDGRVRIVDISPDLARTISRFNLA